MNQKLTLGSLFDGIGGFPFAGEIAGIKPVWAAEVEPMCAAVTKHRFPDMLHFGDVSKLNGADLPPVDIIVFGSPCQDLSVAGLRKGLKHKKNGDKSVMMLQQHMQLTDEELLCIRWHMGAFDDKSMWNNYGQAVAQFPNVLYTHTADMVAARILGI